MLSIALCLFPTDFSSCTQAEKWLYLDCEEN